MDKEIVERVARIAHLILTDDELEKYSSDLGEILEYFEMLDEAPGLENRGFNPVEIPDALRDDEPSMDIPAEDCLKDMKTYDGYVRGPRLS